ncbi:MAG: biphenyl-2,3-diol 1,2-dioxygenase [Chloroflexota bacterium]|nr:MAG: biphenyl-2,3-diol 1,2-dioxygenase [Chloroflexota bacterium]
MNYQTKIGHAHLKVRDLDRAAAFYTKFFSLEFVERVGDSYVFLTGGEFHHEIALQNVGAYAPQPSHESVGLYHVAFEVPDKISFANAYKTLTDAGIKVALVDHCISWAMYFDDPDGNGLEIYWDARNEPDGVKHWRGINLPLEAEDVMAVLEENQVKS